MNWLYGFKYVYDFESFLRTSSYMSLVQNCDPSVVSNHYTVHSYGIVNKRQHNLNLGCFVRANISAITDITIDWIHSR